jgi:hypothetical protein
MPKTGNPSKNCSEKIGDFLEVASNFPVVGGAFKALHAIWKWADGRGWTKQVCAVFVYGIAYPLALPALCALLLIGVGTVLPQAADTYASLIHNGFQLRKTALEVVEEDRATIDYYQLIYISQKLTTDDAGEEKIQIPLNIRQRATIKFGKVLWGVTSSPNCTPPPTRGDAPVFKVKLGEINLPQPGFGFEAASVELNEGWWNENEKVIQAQGIAKPGERLYLPLSVSIDESARNTLLRRQGAPSTASAECTNLTTTISIEVFKNRYAARATNDG